MAKPIEVQIMRQRQPQCDNSSSSAAGSSFQYQPIKGALTLGEQLSMHLLASCLCMMLSNHDSNSACLRSNASPVAGSGWVMLQPWMSCSSSFIQLAHLAEAGHPQGSMETIPEPDSTGRIKAGVSPLPVNTEYPCVCRRHVVLAAGEAVFGRAHACAQQPCSSHARGKYGAASYRSAAGALSRGTLPGRWAPVRSARPALPAARLATPSDSDLPPARRRRWQGQPLATCPALNIKF